MNEAGDRIAFRRQPGVAVRGAIYLFEDGGAGPRLRRVIKPNTATAQQVFPSLGFANNGRTLLVGAIGDASNATGIDGDRNDTSAPDSGALWLY
jgi:hypothetical protein